VGAAAAGGAVAGGAGVGAAAAHGVQTVVFDAARAGSALPTVISAATKPVRSLGSKLAIAGGVVVATAVVAVGAYAVTNGGNSDNGDNTSANPGPTSTSQATIPSPTVDPVIDTDPVGAWNLRSVVVKSDNPAFAKVGSDASNTTWRFTPTCADAATCGGAIKSSSGRAYQYTWNGRSITIAGRDPEVAQGLCTDDAGKKAPGTHFKEVQKSSVVRLIGNGTRYVGTAVVSSRVTELRGNCVNAYAKTGAPAPHATYRWVLSAK
jgi:hypothetical protein